MFVSRISPLTLRVVVSRPFLMWLISRLIVLCVSDSFVVCVCVVT